MKNLLVLSFLIVLALMASVMAQVQPYHSDWFDFRESLGIQVDTTANSPSTKISWSTVALPAGRYLVNWSASMNADSTTQDFIFDIQVDTASVLVHPIRWEPKDAANNPDQVPGTGSNQWLPVSGWRVLNLSAGNHTLEMVWDTSANGAESSIGDASMMIRRLD